MFPLPSEFPLSEYVGHRVERVEEGSHYVFLHLAPRGSTTAYIQFEGPAIFRRPAGEEIYITNEHLLRGRAVFALLMDTEITAVSRLFPASCRFEFSNGYALDLIGETGGYESYHLSISGQACDV
jgi:hypothetical protein